VYVFLYLVPSTCSAPSHTWRNIEFRNLKLLKLWHLVCCYTSPPVAEHTLPETARLLSLSDVTPVAERQLLWHGNGSLSAGGWWTGGRATGVTVLRRATRRKPIVKFILGRFRLKVLAGRRTRVCDVRSTCAFGWDTNCSSRQWRVWKQFYADRHFIFVPLTLSLLMSYIYGAPCKARNFNVEYSIKIRTEFTCLARLPSSQTVKRTAVPVYTMKAYRGIRGYFHTFLTAALKIMCLLEGEEWRFEFETFLCVWGCEVVMSPLFISSA
jgi:hypothetical protein